MRCGSIHPDCCPRVGRPSSVRSTHCSGELSRLLYRLTAACEHSAHGNDPVNHPWIAGYGDWHAGLLEALCVGFGLVSDRTRL